MDENQEATQAQPEKQALRVWAEKAGHLPELFEGDKMRPARFNRKSWMVKAVCLQQGLTLDSEIDERTYNEAVAALSAVEAR